MLSVREETYPDLECVVVDDGGTIDDRTVHDILPAARLVHGKSFGVARARNLGLTEARGQYIIYLDDDDVALPARIATLVAQAEMHGAEVCYGLTRRVGGFLSGCDVPTYPDSARDIGFRELLICAPHINAVLAQTDALRAAGGFDEGAEHFDDWSLWLRLADRGARIRFIPVVVSEWRLHDLGLTGAVHRANAMGHRFLTLFDRLRPLVSADSARAVALASGMVEQNRIDTYDDYAELMAERDPAAATSARTFCPPFSSHP